MLVNNKCQHLYSIEIHFNIHQHALVYIFLCFPTINVTVELKAIYTNMGSDQMEEIE